MIKYRVVIGLCLFAAAAMAPHYWNYEAIHAFL